MHFLLYVDFYIWMYISVLYMWYCPFFYIVEEGTDKSEKTWQCTCKGWLPGNSLKKTTTGNCADSHLCDIYKWWYVLICIE